MAEPETDNFEAQSFESRSVLLNSGDLFMTWMIILSIFLLVKVLSVLTKTCPRGHRCVRNVNNAYTYGIFLRTIVETHLEMSVSSLLNVRRYSFDSTDQIASSIIAVLIAVFFVVVFPIFALGKVIANPGRLHDRDFVLKFGTLFHAFDLRVKSRYLYYWQFLGRRIVFAFILVFGQSWPDYQILIFNALCMFCLFWHIKVQPFSSKVMNQISILNEAFVTAIALVCLVFVQENYTGRQDTYGSLMILLLGIMAGTNMLIIMPFNGYSNFVNMKKWC